jgi:GDP-L-fucose synthase
MTTRNISKNAKIYVAGHRGMVGSALWRLLEQRGYTNLVGRNSAEMDLRHQESVARFFREEKPEYVFLAAARVGGILANSTRPGEFIYDNLALETNLIAEARKNDVHKLLFLGSSCIYPRLAPQPIREESLLSGPLEPTNAPYAVAKIAGIVLCQSFNRQYGTNYISVMPTNLYGPGDNFDPESSHVLPGMIHKFEEARKKNSPEVILWGTGSPKREFLHVDDLARACLHLMECYEEDEPVNVGTGEDCSIRELAEKIREATGYGGEIRWDTSKPNGTPRKLLDVSRIHELGWHHSISLEEGIRTTLEWYRQKKRKIQDL